MIFVKIILKNDLKFACIDDIIIPKLQNYTNFGGKLMKKILSVMLAVMMLFGALSIGASAATGSEYWGTTVKDGLVVSEGTHTILSFDFAGGSSTNALNVYSTEKGGFVSTENVSGVYIMLPGSKAEYVLTAGSSVKAPYVEAPEGYKFNGWFCYANGEYYVAGEKIVIENDWITNVVEFEAQYIPAKVEGDTLKTILGVLSKVFGTVIGILFLDGSSAAGIELVEKLLANISF